MWIINDGFNIFVSYQTAVVVGVVGGVFVFITVA